MPSATTPTTNATSHPDIPTFPPPSTFTILPEIYLLVTRLDLLQQSQSGSTNNTLQPATPNGATLPPISTKDLPALTHPIKQKLAKARTAVLALPDVERGVEAQEEEIRMLEARVEALRGRLGELGTIAGQKTGADGEGRNEAGDVTMGGVEG